MRSNATFFVMYLMQGFIIFWFLTCNTHVDGKKESSTSECVPSSIDYSLYHCFPNRSLLDMSNDDEDDDDDNYGLMCNDAHESCLTWSQEGECQRNPRYMTLNCRKSCNTCVDGHGGITQIAPEPALREHVMKRLLQTAKYVRDLSSRNIQTLKTCHNIDPMCTYWAVKGRCESHVSDMKKTCPATCHMCHG
jgi:ShK domain-like